MATFIVFPTNIDYLIDDVRIRIGDLEEDRFSDTIIRSALISSIKTLQKKWNARYLVFSEGTIVNTLPSGVYYRTDYDALVASGVVIDNPTIVESGYVYAALPHGYGIIPSGLRENDVFRNPYQTFSDVSPAVVTQGDETPVVLQACVILQTSHMTSSAESFMSWSDGEFSASSITSGKIYESLLKDVRDELKEYFKQRLAQAQKEFF